MRKGMMRGARVCLGSFGAAAATTSVLVTKNDDRLINTQIAKSDRVYT
jgi:hypothetical protein